MRKLEPGHRLTAELDTGRVEVERYWRMEWAEDGGDDEQTWTERLDAAVGEAVRSQLVSDVPFGAFLSGGVDSSTVAAHMGDALGGDLRTFTIGFDDEVYDERTEAREAVERIGSRHTERVVALDVLGMLPELVHHYGEPFADSSALCTWQVCRTAREHVKMVLSGDGGDELFAGYSYYPKLVGRSVPLRGRLRRGKRWIGDLARSAGLLARRPALAENWFGRSPWFDADGRARLWRAEARPGADGVLDWHRERFAGLDEDRPLDAYQYVDLTTYLPGDNLTKVDIASMAHGLEVRVPLLDDALVDLARHVPAGLRLPAAGDVVTAPELRDCGKYLLKRAASRHHPWEFLVRHKRGFSVPLDRWFAELGAGALRERLHAREAALDACFEPAEIDRLVEEHGRGAQHGHRLWALLVFAEWSSQRGRRAPVPSSNASADAATAS